MSGLAVIIGHLRLQHGRALVASKTPKECLHWRIEGAEGKWIQELQHMVLACEDRKSLQSMSFLDEARWRQATEWEISLDAALAETCTSS